MGDQSLYDYIQSITWPFADIITNTVKSDTETASYIDTCLSGFVTTARKNRWILSLGRIDTEIRCLPAIVETFKLRETGTQFNPEDVLSIQTILVIGFQCRETNNGDFTIPSGISGDTFDTMVEFLGKYSLLYSSFPGERPVPHENPRVPHASHSIGSDLRMAWFKNPGTSGPSTYREVTRHYRDIMIDTMYEAAVMTAAEGVASPDPILESRYEDEALDAAMPIEMD